MQGHCVYGTIYFGDQGSRRISTGTHHFRRVYLSPDWNVDGAVWHVRGIEYSIIVRLPGGRIEGFRSGSRSVVEGQHGVRFGILKLYELIFARVKLTMESFFHLNVVGGVVI